MTSNGTSPNSASPKSIKSLGPRCIAFVGPFQSGKTTLLEAILARTGAIPRQGTVDTGTTVVYGMHGKCVVRAVESRQHAGEAIAFYKLEPQKSALSRSTRQEPAIWVPLATAQERGLRAPVDADSAQEVLKILASREV